MTDTSSTKDKLSKKLSDAKETVTETTKEVASEVTARGKAHAKAAKDEAEAKISAEIADKQDKAAGEAEALAKHMRDTAGDLTDGSPQARVAATLASQADRAATAIRTADVRSLMDDTATFARRNPAVFVAGAALAGFAVSRLLKASAPTPTQIDASHRPAGGTRGGVS